MAAEFLVFTITYIAVIPVRCHSHKTLPLKTPDASTGSDLPSSAANGQDFLLSLSDALRNLSDATAIQWTASRMLGEYLKVGRVLYVEVEGSGNDAVAVIVSQYVRDLPRVPDQVPYVAFCDGFIGELYDAGETVVVSDAQTDPRFDETVRASWKSIRVSGTISLALNKKGKQPVIFGIHHEPPRQWTEGEVRLVREVAERTWADAERARTEKFFRDSEEKYRTLFNSIDTGFCVCDLIFDENGNAVDLFFVEANPAYDRLTGIAASGKRVKEIFPNIEAVWYELYARVLATGIPERREDYTSALDKWYSVYVSRVGDAGSRRFAVVCDDITERKHREGDQLKASEELKRLLRLRDDFIGVASHELKTPVTSMKAYAEIVKENLDAIGDTTNSNYLARLDAQIDRLTNLINHLLDTTRIAEGKLQLNIEDFDFRDLVNERVTEIQPSARQQIIIECDATLPINADRERLGQVITNLLSNAVKYSPPDSEITVTCSASNDAISVCVTDKGYGIRKEDQQKIFERFYRVESGIMGTFPGMGLGLYISAEVIERHHGRLWVESQPFSGSTFCFSIPKKHNSA